MQQSISDAPPIQFVLGSEEPICASGFLFELDEKSNELLLHVSGNDDVHRYSFVAAQPRYQSWSLPEGILGDLLQAFAVERWWVVHVWDCDPSGWNRIRGRVTKFNLERAGWSVECSNGLGAAFAPFDPAKQLGLGTEATAREIGTTFLIGAKLMNHDMLFSSPSAPSIRAILRFGKLSPSREMLTHLSQSDVSVVYPHQSQSGRSGLVAVSPHRADFSVLSPWTAEITHGADAGTVWY